MPQTKYFNLTSEGNFTSAIDQVYGDLLTVGGVNWFYAILLVGTMIVVYNKTQNMTTTITIGIVGLALIQTTNVFPLELGRLFGVILAFILAAVVWKAFKG